MGNKASVLPIPTDTRAPWVMLTYDPGKNYKGFKYYPNFQVYSNDSLNMADLSVEPQAPPTSEIQFNLPSTSDVCMAITLNHELSIEELVIDLFRRNENNSIVLSAADKIKILYTWVTNQDILYSKFPLAHDFDTVCYQLQKLQDRDNSYAAFFALLCSYAKVPCVIIKGHVKGGRYSPNTALTDNLIREWNAVLIDKKWRLVDCFWGRVYQGNVVTSEPFYLFPDAKHLIYTHFPEKEKWQLVNEPITVQHFHEKPILKHRFFTMKMKIQINPYINIRCDSGEQEFVFRLCSSNYYYNHFLCAISARNEDREWQFVKPQQNNVQLDFIQIKPDLNEHHEEDEKTDMLFQNDDDDDNKDDDDDSMDDDDDDDSMDDDDKVNDDFGMVLKRQKSVVWPVDKPTPRAVTNMQPVHNAHQRLGAYLKINVRFPKKDYYKVEIIGRPAKHVPYDYVAIYYVNVTWVPDWPVFFPIEPLTGWGPNPYLHKCGLKAISHNKGEIKCYAPRRLQIQFKLLPDAPTTCVKLTYDLKLQSAQAVDTPSTSNHREQSDEDQEMPNKTDKETFRPNREKVINVNVFLNTIGEYVLSFNATLNDTDKSTVINYRIVAQRDPREIKEELARAAAAKLKNAIESNDLTTIENALKSTNPFKNHEIVNGLYFEATKLRRRIVSYKQALRHIRKIDNNMLHKIKGYPNPTPEIVQVMRAFFILLGESPKHLNHWDDIRPLITTLGKKSVKLRIRKTKKEEIPREVVLKAKEALGEKDTQCTLQQSMAVAAMIYWMESVFMIHQC